MKMTFLKGIAMLFLFLAGWGVVGFLFLNYGMVGIEEMIIFGIIALIFWNFKVFLYFLFYFVIVSLVMIIVEFAIAYALGVNYTNFMTKINVITLIFWFLGSLTLDFGISAFLTKRTLEKEKEREYPQEAHYNRYERPPNPNDFNRFDEQKEREEQEEREKNAYERGKREAETKNNEMTEEEAYKWLGVKKGATKEEVHRAYRKLSRQVHPDATGMDTNEIMKRINEAYEKLKKEGLA